MQKKLIAHTQCIESEGEEERENALTSSNTSFSIYVLKQFPC